MKSTRELATKTRELLNEYRELVGAPSTSLVSGQSSSAVVAAHQIVHEVFSDVPKGAFRYPRKRKKSKS